MSRHLIGIRYFGVKASFETMHYKKVTTPQFGGNNRPLQVRLVFKSIDSHDDRLLHAEVVLLERDFG